MANMGCIMLCANAFEGDHLAHYGVMGMKWGVRRYQPYPSDYVGNGRYIGKPSTTPEGLKPTLREKIREYAKSGHALTRAKEYSLDRRIANRAERMQKRFVKKQTNRYAKALGSGNEAKIDSGGSAEASAGSYGSEKCKFRNGKKSQTDFSAARQVR